MIQTSILTLHVSWAHICSPTLHQRKKSHLFDVPKEKKIILLTFLLLRRKAYKSEKICLILNYSYSLKTMNASPLKAHSDSMKILYFSDEQIQIFSFSRLQYWRNCMGETWSGWHVLARKNNVFFKSSNRHQFTSQTMVVFCSIFRIQSKNLDGGCSVLQTISGLYLKTFTWTLRFFSTIEISIYKCYQLCRCQW